MIKAVVGIFNASRPLRVAYAIVSIVSIVFTVVSLIYYGFFDHRIWVNQRIADSYVLVESKQIEVAQLLVEIVPNRGNDYATPQQERLSELRKALTELSGTVTQVDTISEEVVLASNVYRGRIAELSGALVRFDSEQSETQGELLLAVDLWDQAAKQFADAVESRIGRFSQTLLPSA